MAGTQPHQQEHERVTASPEVGGAFDVREIEQELADRVEELAAARRELDAFTYSVAHDLRAPLRLIHAHAQMLKEALPQVASTGPLVHVAEIQRGAQHLSALIDGILTLARLGAVELRVEPVHLDLVVDEAIRRIDAAYRNRTIEWRVGRLPTWSCDRELMQQAVCCLIDNAAKYSSGHPRPQIEIGAQDNCIFVRDNGVGFDMRYAAKLFSPFHRLHRQDEFEGVGAGLAIARRIMERHGGRVWADAQVAKGATFFFTLPA